MKRVLSIAVLALAAQVTVSAQTIADIARQERARRAAMATQAVVLTNESLVVRNIGIFHLHECKRCRFDEEVAHTDLTASHESCACLRVHHSIEINVGGQIEMRHGRFGQNRSLGEYSTSVGDGKVLELARAPNSQWNLDRSGS